MTHQPQEQGRNAYDVLTIGQPLVDILVLLEDRHLKRMGMDVKGGSQLVQSHEELEELLQMIEVMRQEELGDVQQPVSPTSPSTTPLLLDRFQKSQTAHIERNSNYLSPVFVPGGSASNTIKNMSMLGAKCGCIGKLGNDALGAFYKKSMSERGVIPMNTMSETTRTGQVLCLVTPDGDRTMRAYLGASEEMTVEDLSEEDFEGVKLFHVEGYAVYSKDVVIHAMKLAKKANALVSFDLGSFQLVRQFKPLLLHLLRRYVDIVFCNETEAQELIDGTPDECVDFLASICRVAVVTMGPSFCFVKSGKNKYRCPTEPVKAVDTTGAGDCFASGFLYGYLQGYSLEQCARLGSLAGGTVVQYIGAEIPINKWNELKEMVARATFVSHRSSQNTATGSSSLPTSYKRASLLADSDNEGGDSECRIGLVGEGGMNCVVSALNALRQRQRFSKQAQNDVGGDDIGETQPGFSSTGGISSDAEGEGDAVGCDDQGADDLQFDDIHFDSSARHQQTSGIVTTPSSPLRGRKHPFRGTEGRASRSKSGGSVHAFAPIIQNHSTSA